MFLQICCRKLLHYFLNIVAGINNPKAHKTGFLRHMESHVSSNVDICSFFLCMMNILFTTTAKNSYLLNLLFRSPVTRRAGISSAFLHIHKSYLDSFYSSKNQFCQSRNASLHFPAGKHHMPLLHRDGQQR